MNDLARFYRVSNTIETISDQATTFSKVTSFQDKLHVNFVRILSPKQLLCQFLDVHTVTTLLACMLDVQHVRHGSAH